MPPTASLPELDFELLDDRYSRQRLIASWDQQKLANTRIVVAGAGALGNEVLKNLALAGVGNILIVDFDRIEVSNLSRSVLFRDADIGRPKASTAANALRELNPEISVRALDGDLESDLGLGILRESDLVLGCLDSVHARWALNRACGRAGTPWIDAGINATVGEICLYVPVNGPCYECGMTQQMWHQIHERRSCMLLPRKLPPRVIPTTSVIASVTAALQVNEALAFIHQLTSNKAIAQEGTRLAPGETLFVSISPYSVSRFTTPEKPGCPAHETYVPSIFVEAGPSEITVMELLDRVPHAVSLQLDFDVVCGWQCGNCGHDTEKTQKQSHRGGAEARRNAGKGRVMRLSALSGSEATCPACQAARTPELVHEIGRFDSLAGESLQALGVPPRAILRAKTDSGNCCVELTKAEELVAADFRK
jgi:molybdopterin/thiamine biosynthesis adenylyltransferase